MAIATIDSGICGFVTRVTTTQTDDGSVKIDIDSSCEHIRKAAEALNEVEPFNEISFYGGSIPTILQAQYGCPHAACPVFVGIIKAVEVAAGLALPKDVTITIEQ